MPSRSCQGSAAGVAKPLTDAPARAGATLESPAGALPGLVFAFRLRPDGIAEELGVDRAIAVEPRGWLWLHFNLADAWACHFLRLSPYFPAGARIACRRLRPPTAPCERGLPVRRLSRSCVLPRRSDRRAPLPPFRYDREPPRHATARSTPSTPRARR